MSWTICVSFAPCSRQIAMPAFHNSIIFRLGGLPDIQPTVSEHWKQKHWTATNNSNTNTCAILTWQIWGAVCVHFVRNSLAARRPIATRHWLPSSRTTFLAAVFPASIRFVWWIDRGKKSSACGLGRKLADMRRCYVRCVQCMYCVDLICCCCYTPMVGATDCTLINSGLLVSFY